MSSKIALRHTLSPEQLAQRRKRAGRAMLWLFAPVLLLLTLDRIVTPHFWLTWNQSPSLPGKLFVVHGGVMPRCGEEGELAVFYLSQSARWMRGAQLTKIARGCPGDVIAYDDDDLLINGVRVAHLKHVLASGDRLPAVQAGVIPPHHYFMMGTHEDSYDSRYAEFGLIPAQWVVGRATRVF